MDENSLLILLQDISKKNGGDGSEIKLLGTGENFINFTVESNGKRNVIRVFKREGQDKVEEEFEWLKLLPHDIGPNPIKLDTTKKIIPFPYMIQSFVVGNRVKDWGDEELKALALTMSSFHKIKGKYFGENNSKITTLVMVDFLNKLNSYFFDKNKSLMDDKDIKEIRPKVLKYLEDNQTLFDSIKEFSLIHGDMTNQNMVYDGKKLRIIDWEAASYGDNALDFATFYYDDFPYYKWRVHLKEDQIKILVNEYQKHIPDKTLADRIKVWLVFDKFCSLLYCKWKLDEYDKNPKEKITITKEELNEEIEKIKKSLH